MLYRTRTVALLLIVLLFQGMTACLILHSGPRSKSSTPRFYNDRASKTKTQQQSSTKPGQTGIRSQSFGYSVQGRPIIGYRIGKGQKTALVLGGINGDEPGGETLLNELVEHLSTNPDGAAGLELIIIPSCNPDALETESSLNANNIDLDRNFPSKNWGKADLKGESLALCGTGPGSEPETMAILKAVEAYPPDLVVSVQGSAASVGFEGAGAFEYAYTLSEMCQLPVNKLEARSGSLGSYFGKDKKIPYVCLELAYRHKRYIMPPFEAQRYLGALMSLFSYVVIGGTMEEQEATKEKNEAANSQMGSP